MMNAYFRLVLPLHILFRLALMLLVVVCQPSAFAAGDSAVEAQAADIEVFVRDGCPHCAKAEAFLQKLAQETPALHIVIHNISSDPASLLLLQQIAEKQKISPVRVPAFYLHGQLIIGYADDLSTGKWIRDELEAARTERKAVEDSAGSCEAVQTQSCEAPTNSITTSKPESFEIKFLGRQLSLEQVGLPLFTVVMGLLDGFNPCSIWVLILMISLLAPMQNRARMIAVAGAFVVVEGIAYFVFMAAWLSLFLLIGLSRISEIIIALIAIVAGALNLKDFWAFGWGVSLSIPASAKPGIYTRMRKILQAENLWGAMIGAVVLAVLVQIVELFCTSGFPALYTRILTLKQLDGPAYYGYLLLYNAAYMLDDVIVLAIGVITLTQHRLQEKEGRWLKLISGLVMVGLGVYLLIVP
jgi:glutaredoxin